ncbi:MAG: response regulator [Deltaproteobacteria bacterium]|nr:response regulator [Deltaproteobacteria bacterium]
MNKKILIVDDEPEQIDFASTILEENGYIPISATNGMDGMKMVRSEKPALILLDIMMPRQGGVGMYRELKQDEATKDIPVVIVTGVTRGGGFDEHMVTQGDELPAPDGYIEKPMNPDAVVKLIHDLLSGS